MLEQLVQEWETAKKNAVVIEDRMAEDGQTIEMRTSEIRFRGTKITIQSRLRPSSNPSKGADVDPSKRQAGYLLTLYFESTGRTLESVPSNDICPTTEFMISILERLDANDHEKVVSERKAAHAKAMTEAEVKRWEAKLANTAFDDKTKEIIVNHCRLLANAKLTKYRIDVYLDILAKYDKLILGKDLDFSQPKAKYSFVDVMYNMCCTLIHDCLPNTHGDDFIPVKRLETRFWKVDDPVREAKYPVYVAKTRATFRSIYTDCKEKPVVLAYVVHGLAKIYEYLTGESIAFHTARENERRKLRKQQQGQYVKRVRIESKNLVSVGDVFEGANIDLNS